MPWGACGAAPLQADTAAFGRLPAPLPHPLPDCHLWLPELHAASVHVSVTRTAAASTLLLYTEGQKHTPLLLFNTRRDEPARSSSEELPRPCLSQALYCP